MNKLRFQIQNIIASNDDDSCWTLDEITSLIEKAIKEMNNTREYGPSEDMFGVGYDQAKKDIIKMLLEL